MNNVPMLVSGKFAARSKLNLSKLIQCSLKKGKFAMAAVFSKGPSYIPGPNKDFDEWFMNFNSQLAALTASTLGLTSSDLSSISSAYASWHAAFASATTPNTATTPIIRQMQDLRKIVTDVIRPIVRKLKGVAYDAEDTNETTSSTWDGYLLSLGIKPNKTGRTRVVPPSEGPTFSVICAAELQLKLKFEQKQSIAPAPGHKISRKKKPNGVRSCQVAYQVGNSGIIVQDFTRTPLIINFLPRDAGQVVALRARWVTSRGDYSPWSTEVTFTVPSGSPYQEAVRMLPSSPVVRIAPTETTVRGLIENVPARIGR